MSKINVLGSYRLDLENAHDTLERHLFRKLGGKLSASELAYIERLSKKVQKCRDSIKSEEQKTLYLGKVNGTLY